ncbi:uncharacterized protein CcaverHIS019_0108960 [Cutaneotrichosporon cavernicola]|uniref:DNA-directed RNA polymerase III subunit RPC4 n=1 Tax=Cutaneotrichosporon cavernicola TaxID=279322 RepID=A0AA48L277_9TREE|nr:uncharacterized protein CcaverHIS019_0108960 [Cutaneotrichosporon cavernicola]BEI88178.1 hypothetical protein CcaverHIS019_0108960 [Cutaneotrichosporon cavernicola]BEI95950.1 hypothetical protein CcaverHIS631_0108990 [Cutaneotrichosporon cavernicola]BEJ03724.1 hypothetical protein CcaverHIS641_0108990 [Cutaneotrichosporon cavernicola]
MSGRDEKPKLPRMPGQARRGRPSLVAAAAAAAPATADASVTSMLGEVDSILTTGGQAMDIDAPAPSAPVAPPVPVDVKPVIPRAGPSSAPMVPSRSGSGPSSRPITPGPPTASGDGLGPGPARLKFKPKMPIRRAVAEPEVKVEPVAVRGGRGRGIGRGRGAPRGRGGGRGAAPLVTVAAGPFGGTRSAGAIRRVIPPAPPRNYMADVTSAEVYSDNEDGPSHGGGGGGVIDIEAVSGLGESAPTSVYRLRDLDGGKAKAKAADKAKMKEAKRRKQDARNARAAHLAAGVAAPRIKDEPVSPSTTVAHLPEFRHGDSMIAADMEQDRDAEGRRVGGMDMSREISGVSTLSGSGDIDAANALDLSESEDEEYEEDMEGDFVFVPGMDNPEDKLFTFQFPTTFPRFASRDPQPEEEKKEDVKPPPAALRKKKVLPPPEGRVGTLVVMKSGKVKLVLGEGEQGIVMNVNAGVPSTFLTQLVHVDGKKHSTTVLGEVHKSYTAMPDVDRLLDQLFLNGGETPGDRERAARKEANRQARERGLVKMEPSSP